MYDRNTDIGCSTEMPVGRAVDSCTIGQHYIENTIVNYNASTVLPTAQCYSVRPDWAMFEWSGQQIFLKSSPKFGDFWRVATLITFLKIEIISISVT